jgi:hypothetical protein
VTGNNNIIIISENISIFFSFSTFTQLDHTPFLFLLGHISRTLRMIYFSCELRTKNGNGNNGNNYSFCSERKKKPEDESFSSFILYVYIIFVWFYNNG